MEKLSFQKVNIHLVCIVFIEVRLKFLNADKKEEYTTLGDILGYKSLLCREPFSASAIALDDCTICLIPRNQIFETIQNKPKLSMKML